MCWVVYNTSSGVNRRGSASISSCKNVGLIWQVKSVWMIPNEYKHLEQGSLILVVDMWQIVDSHTVN